MCVCVRGCDCVFLWVYVWFVVGCVWVGDLVCVGLCSELFDCAMLSIVIAVQHSG